MRTANQKPRRTRKQMRLPLFKTNGTTDSRIKPDPRTKDHRNATIVTDPEITGTGMQNIASSVISRSQEECQKRIRENQPCKDKQ
jgi:hypothetical protein